MCSTVPTTTPRGQLALLEIAEAYARAAADGRRPRRERHVRGVELGGARTSRRVGVRGKTGGAAVLQTAATLNMDMIGRNEEVRVGGGRRFRGLELQTAESNQNAVNIMGYSYSADSRGRGQRSQPRLRARAQASLRRQRFPT